MSCKNFLVLTFQQTDFLINEILVLTKLCDFKMAAISSN